MSGLPHYLNRAFHDGEAYGGPHVNPVDDELEQTDDVQDDETGDDIDEESSEEEEGVEEEEEEEEDLVVSSNVDVQVTVVSPGIAIVDGSSTPSSFSQVRGAAVTNGQGAVTKQKKVLLKSLVIPDHLLHKKYQSPCHALCTVQSPKAFITCVAFIFFIHGLFTQYSQHAIVATVARYPLSQMEIRFMNGLEHTGIVVGVVFMSFFSNRFHRPLTISVGALMCAVGSIFCAIPYFAEGQMDNVSFREISLFLRGETCQKYNLSFTFQGTCNLVANQKYSDVLAFSLICLGQFIVGLGASLYVTNSVVHIEENVSLKTSTACLGVCLSVHGLGMFGGSLLATGLSVLPEGITGDIPLVALREKVGPWWFGFCITTGLFFFGGLFFLCFPRWFVEPDWLLRRRERYYKKLVARKKQADRQKILLSRKLKKKKAALQKVTPEGANRSGGPTGGPTGGPIGGPIGGPTGKGRKTPQKGAKRNRKDQRVPTVGADIIRVPNQVGESNLAYDETGESGGSDPVDHGTINSTFVSDDHLQFDSEIQSSHQAGAAQANQYKKHTTANAGNGQISDSTQQPPTDTTQVGATTLKYIKKTGRSKVSKKYLMRREQFKDISRHIWRLLRNRPLALCFVGTILSSYTITGYTAVLTTFLKVRFHQSHYNAEFATAFITPFGFCIGTLFGGLIVSGVQKLRENLHFSSRIIVGFLPITCICMTGLIFLSCDIKDHSASLLKNPDNWTCIERCDCTDTLQDPVCGDDGYVYPSACLAGCHYIDSDPDPLKYTFSTCECIDTPSARASYGVCPTECFQFYIYIAVASTGMVAFFMGLVPVVMVFLRAVRDRYRSLSLGFGVWLVYILGYIMGPVMFNEILDLHCQHFTENCQKEKVCWYYDTENLSLMLHGTVLVGLVIGFFSFIGMCVQLMPGRFTNPADESKKLALGRVGESSNIANNTEVD